MPKSEQISSFRNNIPISVFCLVLIVFVVKSVYDSFHLFYQFFLVGGKMTAVLEL